MKLSERVLAISKHADAAGMPLRAGCQIAPNHNGRAPRERVFGAWGDLQRAIVDATGTPSVREGCRRLRYHGMSLRIGDVIIELRDVREHLSTAAEEPTYVDASCYEALAARALAAIQRAIQLP